MTFIYEGVTFKYNYLPVKPVCDHDCARRGHHREPASSEAGCITGPSVQSCHNWSVTLVTVELVSNG